MTVINKYAYYLNIARAVAAAGTCNEFQAGAVIVQNDRIVATGYNSAPFGKKTCLDVGCLKDENDLCRRVLHADQMAIMSAPVELTGATIYATHSPSDAGINMILSYGIVKVVYERNVSSDCANELLGTLSSFCYQDNELVVMIL